MSLPDVSPSRMRNDFLKIFNMHKHKCELISFNDAQAGDFFDVNGDRSEKKRFIEISIQGNQDNIMRLMQGIEIPDASVKCYCKHDTKINATDLIKIWDKYYKINNIQPGVKNGEIIFYSFNLQYSTNRNY